MPFLVESFGALSEEAVKLVDDVLAVQAEANVRWKAHSFRSFALNLMHLFLYAARQCRCTSRRLESSTRCLFGKTMIIILSRFWIFIIIELCPPN